jgi:hypothetical protein
VLEGAGLAGAGVLGGVPVADAGSSGGAGLTGVVAGAAEGFGAGLAVEGIVRLGFCLSGNTNAPFWPHAISIAVKLIIVNSRTPLMPASIPAVPGRFDRNFYGCVLVRVSSVFNGEVDEADFMGVYGDSSHRGLRCVNVGLGV